MPASTFLTGCAKLRSQLLDGIAPPDLDIILAAGSHRHFPSRAVIAKQGDPADHLFLLTKGRARQSFATEEGKRIMLLWLASGQIFGGAALLSKPSAYLIDTEAVGPCSVLMWDRTTIRELAARYPRLFENAIWTASEYMSWFCAALAALSTQSAQQRLRQVVECLAQVIGRKVPEGVELDVINEELAEAASITPYTTSRLLNEWQRRGVITKRRGKILLHSMN